MIMTTRTAPIETNAKAVVVSANPRLPPVPLEALLKLMASFRGPPATLMLPSSAVLLNPETATIVYWYVPFGSVKTMVGLVDVLLIP